jgi:cysteine synthase A
MIDELDRLSKLIGNTPLIDLKYPHAHLYAKLEYTNFSGSSKDRAAFSILRNAILSGKINQESTIVTSSSGNLAVALGTICKVLKVKFIPVIDPNVNKANEALLKLISYKTVKVNKRDETGGYLLTRIATVNQICNRIGNSFFADQYCDINNYKGYYRLGNEILASVKCIDFVFIAVSSSGAITGVSRIIKEKHPATRIVAVDVRGSVIFGQASEKRYLSGIGSSQVSPIMKDAIIDDVMILSQLDIIQGCHELLEEQAIFAGASSGAVYLAAKRYFEMRSFNNLTSAVMIFPDKGYSYLDTVYSKRWKKEIFGDIHQPI